MSIGLVSVADVSCREQKPDNSSVATKDARWAGWPLLEREYRLFWGLTLGPWLIRPALAGPHGNRISLIIILAVGVAVTSIPVVSKIFADLNILHTRFARVVLGVAVLEDIVLWLALAVATAVAAGTALNTRQMSLHLITTVVFFAAGTDDPPESYQENQQVQVQYTREALARRPCDCSSARILCSCRRTECQPGICSISCWLRSST